MTILGAPPQRWLGSPDADHPRAHSVYAAAGWALVALGVAILVAAAISAARSTETTPEQGNWLRLGYDATASRTNTAESQIDLANVHKLRLLWRSRLPAAADSSPAYLHGLHFPDGTTRNVLYLTTTTGGLIALDADTGMRLWARPASIADPAKITTSSPLADPSANAVYAYGLDGRVHKYDLVTGREILTNGWPVRVTNMPLSEKESSALNAANGLLYVTTASFGGDAPPYQGHLVAIDLATGAKHVFNAVCADRTHLLAAGECRESGAGIWARPGVVVDPRSGHIFLATGNGPFTAEHGGQDWGESVLELTRDATRVLDSYTPAAANALSPQDLDLGSAAPALLPPVPASSTPYLAVQADKEGVLRLLNRANLSGRGGPGHTGGELQIIDAPDHCPVLTQPAVWTDPTTGAIWVFVADGCATSGYQIVTLPDHTSGLRQVWTFGHGATSPAVAGSILFMASADPNEQAVLALDPRTGRQVWSSTASAAEGSIGTIHWQSPIVVNGHVYCSDEQGDVMAYGLR